MKITRWISLLVVIACVLAMSSTILASSLIDVAPNISISADAPDIAPSVTFDAVVTSSVKLEAAYRYSYREFNPSPKIVAEPVQITSRLIDRPDYVPLQ